MRLTAVRFFTVFIHTVTVTVFKDKKTAVTVRLTVSPKSPVNRTVTPLQITVRSMLRILWDGLKMVVSTPTRVEI